MVGDASPHPFEAQEAQVLYSCGPWPASHDRSYCPLQVWPSARLQLLHHYLLRNYTTNNKKQNY